MNFFTELFQRFSSHPKEPEILLKSDMKFSALIQSIQRDMLEANQSLECVGIKYIEQFFDKEPDVNRVKDINNKFNVIEKVLDRGDTHQVNKLLLDLKSDVNGISTHSEGDTPHYRPKMTTFEIPTLIDGVWAKEKIMIPLLALSPVSIPKIKALTIKSTLQSIHHEDEEVYVRLVQDEVNSKRKRKAKKEDINNNETTLEISITPEQSRSELQDVITHYEQILRLS